MMAGELAVAVLDFDLHSFFGFFLCAEEVIPSSKDDLLDLICEILEFTYPKKWNSQVCKNDFFGLRLPIHESER